MDGGLVPMSDADDAAWRDRYDELNQWRKKVHLVANDPATVKLPAVRTLRCPQCAVRGGSEQGWLGKVVATELGVMLLSRRPTEAYVDGESTATPTQWREATGNRLGDTFEGFVLAGPNSYADMFAWRPASKDDVPHLICDTHGRILPEHCH